MSKSCASGGASIERSQPARPPRFDYDASNPDPLSVASRDEVYDDRHISLRIDVLHGRLHFGVGRPVGSRQGPACGPVSVTRRTCSGGPRPTRRALGEQVADESDDRRPVREDFDHLGRRRTSLVSRFWGLLERTDQCSVDKGGEADRSQARSTSMAAGRLGEPPMKLLHDP